MLKAEVVTKFEKGTAYLDSFPEDIIAIFYRLIMGQYHSAVADIKKVEDDRAGLDLKLELNKLVISMCALQQMIVPLMGRRKGLDGSPVTSELMITIMRELRAKKQEWLVSPYAQGRRIFRTLAMNTKATFKDLGFCEVCLRSTILDAGSDVVKVFDERSLQFQATVPAPPGAHGERGAGQIHSVISQVEQMLSTHGLYGILDDTHGGTALGKKINQDLVYVDFVGSLATLVSYMLLLQSLEKINRQNMFYMGVDPKFIKRSPTDMTALAAAKEAFDMADRAFTEAERSGAGAERSDHEGPTVSQFKQEYRAAEAALESAEKSVIDMGNYSDAAGIMSDYYSNILSALGIAQYYHVLGIGIGDESVMPLPSTTPKDAFVDQAALTMFLFGDLSNEVRAILDYINGNFYSALIELASGAGAQTGVQRVKAICEIDATRSDKGAEYAQEIYTHLKTEVESKRAKNIEEMTAETDESIKQIIQTEIDGKWSSDVEHGARDWPIIYRAIYEICKCVVLASDRAKLRETMGQLSGTLGTNEYTMALNAGRDVSMAPTKTLKQVYGHNIKEAAHTVYTLCMGIDIQGEGFQRMPLHVHHLKLMETYHTQSFDGPIPIPAHVGDIQRVEREILHVGLLYLVGAFETQTPQIALQHANELFQLPNYPAIQRGLQEAGKGIVAIRTVHRQIPVNEIISFLIESYISDKIDTKFAEESEMKEALESW